MNNNIADEPLTESEYAEVLGKIVHSYNNYLAASMGFNELSLLLSTDDSPRKNSSSDDLLNSNYSKNALQSCQRGVDFGQSLLASVGRLQLSLQEYNGQLLFKEIEEQLSTKAKFNFKKNNI